MVKFPLLAKVVLTLAAIAVLVMFSLANSGSKGWAYFIFSIIFGGLGWLLKKMEGKQKVKWRKGKNGKFNYHIWEHGRWVLLGSRHSDSYYGGHHGGYYGGGGSGGGGGGGGWSGGGYSGGGGATGGW
jgi:hypothetical protein